MYSYYTNQKNLFLTPNYLRTPPYTKAPNAPTTFPAYNSFYHVDFLSATSPSAG